MPKKNPYKPTTLDDPAVMIDQGFTETQKHIDQRPGKREACLDGMEGVRHRRGAREPGGCPLDICAAAEASDAGDGNGAVRRGEPGVTLEAAEAAAEAFLDFCERRGITEQEKDLIWNALAFICYEQVQEPCGPAVSGDCSKTVG
jgi:hypothetical protein